MKTQKKVKVALLSQINYHNLLIDIKRSHNSFAMAFFCVLKLVPRGTKADIICVAKKTVFFSLIWIIFIALCNLFTGFTAQIQWNRLALGLFSVDFFTIVTHLFWNRSRLMPWSIRKCKCPNVRLVYHFTFKFSDDLTGYTFGCSIQTCVNINCN